MVTDVAFAIRRAVASPTLTVDGRAVVGKACMSSHGVMPAIGVDP